jgi:hypothetical protein
LIDVGQWIAKGYLLQHDTITAIQFLQDLEPDFILAPGEPILAAPHLPLSVFGSDAR